MKTLLTLAAITLALPAAAEEVTLRYMASQGGIAAHELAERLGYFEGTGIHFENVGYAQGGPATLIALAGGSVEIGGAATPAVLNAIASGNDFVIAYPTNGVNETVHSTFYVLPDSPIKDIKDLAGKTIAVNTLGAHLDYIVKEALTSVSLPSDAANLVVVPGPQLEQVLRSNQVDVTAFGYWQQTFEGAALKNSALRPIFTDYQLTGEIAGGFTVLGRDWVTAHPDQAKEFVKESARALDYAREHPDETRQALADILKERGENPEIAQFFAGFGVRKGGLPTEHDLQFWIDALVREGKIKEGALQTADLLQVSSSLNATN
jgi:ABC-type nitrate/sulfonate/bicarbonate transport system substrate-binding protein